MGKATALAFVVALALDANAGRGFSRADLAAPQQFTEAEMAAATIILSHRSNAGFEYEDPNDPRNGADYTVGIYGDGTVTYIWSSGAGMRGTLTHTISSDSARGLVEEFVRADFFGFKDNYRDIYYGGLTRTSRTHEPEATLSLSLGKHSKSVVFMLGVPIKLRQLARRVEEVTDVRRYTGRSLPQVGGHTLSGRVTDNDGVAIVGAAITLAGDTFYESITDTAGRYEISGIFSGDYTLISTAEEFVNAVSKRKVPQQHAPEWNPILTRHVGPIALLDLRSKLNLAAGGTTHDCGEFLQADGGSRADVAAFERSLECAMAARKNGSAFRVVVQQQSSTSWAAHGMAGGPNRSQFLFTFSGGRLIWQHCYGEPVRTEAASRTQINCVWTQ